MVTDVEGEPPKNNHDRIQHVRKGLKELIESNYGLLDHLLSLSVLSRSEISDIRSKGDIVKQNACLLDILDKKDEDGS